RVFQLIIDPWLVGLGAGDETEHQLARERPRLRTEVTTAAHAHAGFLQHFAGDGLLQRFTRFDKAGQHRVTLRRPAALAAQQDARAIGDRHDDCRVGARIVFDPAIIAAAQPAAAREPEGTAAYPAMTMPTAPVLQRAGL